MPLSFIIFLFYMVLRTYFLLLFWVYFLFLIRCSHKVPLLFIRGFFISSVTYFLFVCLLYVFSIIEIQLYLFVDDQNSQSDFILLNFFFQVGLFICGKAVWKYLLTWILLKKMIKGKLKLFVTHKSFGYVDLRMKPQLIQFV